MNVLRTTCARVVVVLIVLCPTLGTECYSAQPATYSILRETTVISSSLIPRVKVKPNLTYLNPTIILDRVDEEWKLPLPSWVNVEVQSA